MNLATMLDPTYRPLPDASHARDIAPELASPISTAATASPVITTANIQQSLQLHTTGYGHIDEARPNTDTRTLAGQSVGLASPEVKPVSDIDQGRLIGLDRQGHAPVIRGRQRASRTEHSADATKTNSTVSVTNALIIKATQTPVKGTTTPVIKSTGFSSHESRQTIDKLSPRPELESASRRGRLGLLSGKRRSRSLVNALHGQSETALASSLDDQLSRPTRTRKRCEPVTSKGDFPIEDVEEDGVGVNNACRMQ